MLLVGRSGPLAQPDYPRESEVHGEDPTPSLWSLLTVSDERAAVRNGARHEPIVVDSVNACGLAIRPNNILELAIDVKKPAGVPRADDDARTIDVGQESAERIGIVNRRINAILLIPV